MSYSVNYGRYKLCQMTSFSALTCSLLGAKLMDQFRLCCGMQFVRTLVYDPKLILIYMTTVVRRYEDNDEKLWSGCDNYCEW